MRVDEVLTLPGLVGDVRQVELARRHRYLLHAPVELVSIRIDIVDRQSGLLALIRTETPDHRLRLQQSHVRQRCDVVAERSLGDVGEADLLAP